MRMATGCALLGLVIALLLLCWPAWRAVEFKVFDAMSVATAPLKSTLPITIIGIDEPSFTQMGQRWPWPRATHAQLVDKLAQSRAAVVVFDLLFSEESRPEDDRAFAEAIARAAPQTSVVLAADHAYHETAAARQWLRVDPVPVLTSAGAATGLATARVDGDAVVRQVPVENDALWREAIRAFIRARPGAVAEPYVSAEALVRHLGPAHTFPYVSYYQVLNGDPNIPANFFEDQIVLVGRDVRASLDSGAAQAENFATPFLTRSGLLTPGVEIHATMMENALMGQTITPAPTWYAMAAAGVMLLLAWPTLVFWHPLRSAVLVVLLGGGWVALSGWLFAALNLWVATAAALVGLVLAYVAMGAASYWTERRRASQIRSAFEMYVSRDVVREMVARPERLRLGGERRELTLLFCDLAGFTSLSERLSPEALTEVINLYLNESTKIIMGLSGTVDKFIGDAIMAFWGAPLDDAEHALHATQAAIGLQDLMHKLQPQFAALGAEGLALRIGLHSGPAVVGNMGSDLRFNYTALGDTVNLAARLEGVNKAYGTGILLSENTAAALNGALSLRPVDRVRVKGKNVPVQVYTPCDDPPLVTATTRAWDAYLARDWDAALTAGAAILAHAPQDPLPAVFAERIAELRSVDVPPDWDGSVALEKL